MVVGTSKGPPSASEDPFSERVLWREAFMDVSLVLSHREEDLVDQRNMGLVPPPGYERAGGWCRVDPGRSIGPRERGYPGSGSMWMTVS